MALATLAPWRRDAVLGGSPELLHRETTPQATRERRSPAGSDLCLPALVFSLQEQEEEHAKG